MIDPGVLRQGLVRCGLGPDDRGCAVYGRITAFVIVVINAPLSLKAASSMHA